MLYKQTSRIVDKNSESGLAIVEVSFLSDKTERLEVERIVSSVASDIGVVNVLDSVRGEEVKIRLEVNSHADDLNHKLRVVPQGEEHPLKQVIRLDFAQLHPELKVLAEKIHKDVERVSQREAIRLKDYEFKEFHPECPGLMQVYVYFDQVSRLEGEELFCVSRTIVYSLQYGGPTRNNHCATFHFFNTAGKNSGRLVIVNRDDVLIQEVEIPFDEAHGFPSEVDLAKTSVQEDYSIIGDREIFKFNSFNINDVDVATGLASVQLSMDLLEPGDLIRTAWYRAGEMDKPVEDFFGKVYRKGYGWFRTIKVPVFDGPQDLVFRYMNYDGTEVKDIVLPFDERHGLPTKRPENLELKDVFAERVQVVGSLYSNGSKDKMVQLTLRALDDEELIFESGGRRYHPRKMKKGNDYKYTFPLSSKFESDPFVVRVFNREGVFIHAIKFKLEDMHSRSLNFQKSRYLFVCPGEYKKPYEEVFPDDGLERHALEEKRLDCFLVELVEGADGTEHLAVYVRVLREDALVVELFRDEVTSRKDKPLKRNPISGGQVGKAFRFNFEEFGENPVLLVASSTGAVLQKAVFDIQKLRDQKGLPSEPSRKADGEKKDRSILKGGSKKQEAVLPKEYFTCKQASLMGIDTETSEMNIEVVLKALLQGRLRVVFSLDEEGHKEITRTSFMEALSGKSYRFKLKALAFVSGQKLFVRVFGSDDKTLVQMMELDVDSFNGPADLDTSTSVSPSVSRKSGPKIRKVNSSTRPTSLKTKTAAKDDPFGDMFGFADVRSIAKRRSFTDGDPSDYSADVRFRVENQASVDALKAEAADLADAQQAAEQRTQQLELAARQLVQREKIAAKKQSDKVKAGLVLGVFLINPGLGLLALGAAFFLDDDD